MLGLVLAAGLGTRLRPLTESLPKPAVPVGNRPLASYAVEHLARAGARRVRANAHHLADALARSLEGHVPSSVDFAVRPETRLLGTGGGIRRLLEYAEAEGLVVVMNGDVLFAPDLAGAIATHRRHGALATMVVRHHPEPKSLGAVELDEAGRVRRIVGRPDAPADGLRAFTFTGVHVLSAEVARHLPREGCVVRDGYIPMLASGLPIAGHVDDAPWIDLGTPATYLEANLALAEGRFPWPGIEGRGSILHPSARATSARIARAVVGAEASIADGVRVEDAVVWPGTRVEHDVVRAIAYPGGVVHAS